MGLHNANQDMSEYCDKSGWDNEKKKSNEHTSYGIYVCVLRQSVHKNGEI